MKTINQLLIHKLRPGDRNYIAETSLAWPIVCACLAALVGVLLGWRI